MTYEFDTPLQKETNMKFENRWFTSFRKLCMHRYFYEIIYYNLGILTGRLTQCECKIISGVSSLHVNAHKTEYMCFNQTGDIPTLDEISLKLVDKFTFLGSSVSSTEKDIDTRLTKT